MTDEKYVAQQTERERKSLATAARRRKTHNGKGGCTLNHERMTRKELEAMNGEVVEYNLSKPMTWKEFKGLPVNLQEAYIYQLVRKYAISANSFSKMVGVASITMSRWGKENPKLYSLFNSSRDNSFERRKKTTEFLKWAGVEEQDPVRVDTVDTIQVETDAPLPDMDFPVNDENKDGYHVFSDHELELLLLRQKVDIYERLLFGGNNNVD